MLDSALKKKASAVVLALCMGGASVFGCTSDTTVQVADGIFGTLGSPLPSATPEQVAAFERGRDVALRRFAPEDGLGPEFNLTFCAGCHEKPALGGGASHYRDFLLVGDELAFGTVVPRGKNGVQRQFSLDSGRASSDQLTNISATRNPIPFFGAGLLAEIPDTEIVSHADPDDADRDGISGRVNYDGMFVGRFGRKAQTSRIELFVRGPIFNHMGITSDPLSAARRAELPTLKGAPVSIALGGNGGVGAIVAAQAVIPDEPTVDLDEAPDPELSESDLFDLVCFTLLLAAPAPDEPTAQTERGEEVFNEIGCEKCHLSSLRGPRGAIPAYTDLLLHDMGDELADGFPMQDSTGREFRTQPLWGIAAASPYLHDGRSPTIDEAIRWHGGEAAPIRDAYVAYCPPTPIFRPRASMERLWLGWMPRNSLCSSRAASSSIVTSALQKASVHSSTATRAARAISTRSSVAPGRRASMPCGKGASPDSRSPCPAMGLRFPVTPLPALGLKPMQTPTSSNRDKLHQRLAWAYSNGFRVRRLKRSPIPATTTTTALPDVRTCSRMGASVDSAGRPTCHRSVTSYGTRSAVSWG
ncbi:MAG: hypothetical protein JRG93_05110 [Deltaproteobacteria bacterium]|nr:hypothetical protein [Deltaproteobacteria bacterium]